MDRLLSASHLFLDLLVTFFQSLNKLIAVLEHVLLQLQPAALILLGVELRELKAIPSLPIVGLLDDLLVRRRWAVLLFF
jgi:hypothetical protein